MYSGIVTSRDARVIRSSSICELVKVIAEAVKASIPASE